MQNLLTIKFYINWLNLSTTQCGLPIDKLCCIPVYLPKTKFDKKLQNYLILAYERLL